MSLLIIKLYYGHKNLKSNDFDDRNRTQLNSCCYAIFTDMQLVTKIVFDENGGFGGVLTRRYQYIVQGKTFLAERLQLGSPRY
jgi:hypothetical protein